MSTCQRDNGRHMSCAVNPEAREAGPAQGTGVRGIKTALTKPKQFHTNSFPYSTSIHGKRSLINNAG